MSFRLYKLGCCFMLSGMACSGLLETQACAQGTHKPRRSIELSETNSAEILTNLNLLTTKQEGADQLEDQLRGLKDLSRSSLEQRLALPYVPRPSTPIPTKTLKELIEQRKNWGLTPEQLGTSSSSSDSDLLSAYEEQKFDGKQPSLQQFYDALNNGMKRQNLTRSADSKNSPDANRGFDSKQDSNFDDDSKLPPGLRDKAQKLKESASDDPGSILTASKHKANFDNFFGLNSSSTVAEGAEPRKTSMETFVDQFKKVLESQPGNASTIDPTLRALLPETAMKRATATLSADPFSTASRQAAPETTTPGTVSVVPSAATVPDLNAAALSRWNSFYNPPKLEIPKITPPTPPNLDFPRRRF